jgi:hypothetical protein
MDMKKLPIELVRKIAEYLREVRWRDGTFWWQIPLEKFQFLTHLPKIQNNTLCFWVHLPYYMIIYNNQQYRPFHPFIIHQIKEETDEEYFEVEFKIIGYFYISRVNNQWNKSMCY